MDKNKIASYIDHTLLVPTATKGDILTLCQEAIRYNFKTVCVNPHWVSWARDCLKGSAVGITTVVGFPLGMNDTVMKAQEAHRAVEHGATEIDMVMNAGALFSGDLKLVKVDIEAVKLCIGRTPLKVILETCQLSDEQIVLACKLASEANADFVKTSTGFGKSGATVEAVRLMKASISDTMEVKASGGIRDLKSALSMLDAGATRLGTSNGVAIMRGLESESLY